MSPQERVKKYRLMNPWVMPRYYALRRCTDPEHREYHRYGGRGVKFDLTMDQAKALFLRDKGILMDKPSLDREDPDGDYTYANCRFMELVDNVARRRPYGSVTKPVLVTARNMKWSD